MKRLHEENYDVGDLVLATGTFTDIGGNPVDPSAVFFSVRDPSANLDTYQYGVDPEVTRSGAGVYSIQVDVDEPGRWKVRCYSTGTGQAADRTSFIGDPVI